MHQSIDSYFYIVPCMSRIKPKKIWILLTTLGITIIFDFLIKVNMFKILLNFSTIGISCFPFLFSEDTIPSGINEKECKLCLSQTLWEDTCTNLETARDSFFVLVAAHVNTNGYWKQNRNYNATLGINLISRSHI